MQTIKNYQQASDFLGRKNERPYAHNTRIQRLNLDRIGVLYHGSCVVTFIPHETIFSSCGWKTLTTKERLNWFLPDGFSVYQEKSVWYLVDRRGGWEDAKRYIFQDGLTIDGQGNVTGAAEEGNQEETKNTIKKIKKYVDGYVKALLDGEVEKPSGGDCWYCYMSTESGESLGDATKNTGHLESHFEESYYVPSLLYRAVEFKDRMCILSKDGVARIWQGEKLDKWQMSVVERDVKSILTTYLKHEFGVAS